ncbi:hypothetical protein H5123_12435 [Shewanella sp. SR43-4]|uniref:hypothetical protein n=1 Tax=Shewanella sp. SR43-4 TaxID=2760942 RepID=UPI0015F836D9|nr:hypothetical protein [Shewanella sp. SR43-4]MBB1318435.1 hypothetical protein [Shewanella sp. SR43-4]
MEIFSIISLKVSKIFSQYRLASMMLLTSTNIALSLINFSLCFSLLSGESFGAWIIVYSIYQWIISFDGGVGNQARNKYTIAEKNGDISLKKILIKEAFKKSGLSLLVIWITWLVISFFINWSQILSGSISIFLLEFMVVFGLLNVWSKLVNKFLFAINLGFVTIIVPVINNLIVTIGLTFLKLNLFSDLLTGHEVYYIASLYIVFSPMLNLLILYKFFNVYFCNIPKALKDELTYKDGAWFFFFQGFSGIILLALPAIVGFLGNTTLAGEAGILLRYYSLPLLILTVFLQYEWRNITLNSTKKITFELSVWNKRLSFSWVLMMFIFLSIFMLDDFILKLWLGDTVKLPLNWSFLFGLLFALIATKRFVTTILQAISSIKRPAVVSLLSLLVILVHLNMEDTNTELLLYSLIISILIEILILVLTMRYSRINHNKEGA